jgi:hypothetical protein
VPVSRVWDKVVDLVLQRVPGESAGDREVIAVLADQVEREVSPRK